MLCEANDLNEIREGLEKIFPNPNFAGLMWRPINTVFLRESGAETLIKLLDVLEDNDDVQSVSSNFEMDDSLLDRLTG